MIRSTKFFLFLLFFSFTGATLIAQRSQIVYLSGTGCDQTVDWDFYCTKGRNAGEWTQIPVPSNWELQGFGNYNYGYDKVEGRADEQGLYRHTFFVPKDWKGKVVDIVFEGSMTDTKVKINGKSAGATHQGAFYRFRYNITDLLKYGSENLLEATVSKISSNASVNKAEREADYWVFGGIYRPVYLEVLPPAHIRQIGLDAAASGKFTANVYLANNKKKNRLRAQIYTLSGEKVGNEMVVNTEGKAMVSVSTRISNPKLWNTEAPNLYKVVFTLLQGNRPIHTVDNKIGFRTIEKHDRDGIYLNGVKIKFKGVNRHSFYPSTGRALSKQLTIEDVKLIKGMNMNGIRNSHYPADDYFYDVCDSLGIMVLDELGGWHDAYDTQVGTLLVKEMMYKSMNHPCVVMWVNGNEGGHNAELQYLYDSLDLQKRPLLQAWQNFRGIDTQHYRDYDYGVGSHYQGHNIVMPTEFLHGMYDGGHGAGLEDFWKLMWNNPLSAGGFLWDFADEAVVRTDKNGILDSDGNHGADGMVGPYREKEASYYAIKEIWAPLYFEHKEITKDFDGYFDVENRYSFTNLHQCAFHWELLQYPLPNSNGKAESISGTASSPDIAPYDKGKLHISLPEGWKNYDVLALTVFGPQGDSVFTWTWPIALPRKVASGLIVKTGLAPITTSEQDTLLTVKAADITLRFSKQTGMLTGVENGKGKISFGNGPVLCEGESTFQELVYKMVDTCLTVEALFDKESVYNTLKWTIYPSGWVKLNIAYSPKVERHTFMGVSFSYPEDMVDSMQWYGDGPFRVWKNRMRGNRLGVWSKAYNNTITGVTYDYPEFKGYHSRMYWLEVFTKEQPFLVVSPQEDVFFRMLTPEDPEDPYNTAPDFPVGDISFMQGIAPMGTKCLQTYRMGPMSDENIYYAYGGNRPKKMVLFFNFSAKR